MFLEIFRGCYSKLISNLYTHSSAHPASTMCARSSKSRIKIGRGWPKEKSMLTHRIARIIISNLWRRFILFNRRIVIVMVSSSALWYEAVVWTRSSVSATTAQKLKEKGKLHDHRVPVHDYYYLFSIFPFELRGPAHFSQWNHRWPE